MGIVAFTQGLCGGIVSNTELEAKCSLLTSDCRIWPSELHMVKKLSMFRIMIVREIPWDLELHVTQ